jgi:hypothetical protein
LPAASTTRSKPTRTNQANANQSTIAGGSNHLIEQDAYQSTVGGGSANKIQNGANLSTIGGGRFNTIQTNAFWSTIGGGNQNVIQTNSIRSTIGGGSDNKIQMNASHSTIGGGFGNTIQTNAFDSTIGGGANNTNSGSYATVPGGLGNSAASLAFAAGQRAKANHQGAFVWGDSTSADVSSSANNEFTARASGGVRFFSNAGLTAGVSLAAGGTSWSVISDRAVKRDFQPVNEAEVLEKLARVPVQQWRYNWENESATPHIVPVAQEFKAAFYPGRDDKCITTLEFDGVALAAIQGLNRKLEERSQESGARIQKLEAENAQLKDRLATLEAALQKLAGQPKSGGGQ